MDRLVEFALSIYTVFLLVDLGQSFVRAQRYKLKYLLVKKEQTFGHLFMVSHTWTIVVGVSLFWGVWVVGTLWSLV